VLLNVSLAGYEAAERAAATSGEDFAGWPAGAATRGFVAGLLAAGGVARQVKAAPELPQLEVSRFRNGEAEYIGIVQGLPRDTSEYTNQLATWPAAQPATVTFPRQAHVYDVRAGKYLGRVDELQTEVRPGLAKLYALLPYSVERLGLTARGPSQPGKPVSYDVRIATGGRPPEAHVVHVTVLDPSGREWECYRTNILAERGRGAGRFTPALNDPPGVWTIRARDAATGVERETKVRVGRG